MSLTTCESCEKEFLTEADPYVVLPKPSGTIVMCLKCATSVARRQGWEQCQSESFITVRKYYGRSLIDANSGERVKAAKDVLLDAIASMEYKEVQDE